MIPWFHHCLLCSLLVCWFHSTKKSFWRSWVREKGTVLLFWNNLKPLFRKITRSDHIVIGDESKFQVSQQWIYHTKEIIEAVAWVYDFSSESWMITTASYLWYSKEKKVVWDTSNSSTLQDMLEIPAKVL